MDYYMPRFLRLGRVTSSLRISGQGFRWSTPCRVSC